MNGYFQPWLVWLYRAVQPVSLFQISGANYLTAMLASEGMQDRYQLPRYLPHTFFAQISNPAHAEHMQHQTKL